MRRWRALAGITFVVGVSLCRTGVVVADTAKPAPTRCKMTATAELSVKFEHNRPLVEATLNGHKGWFLVDTGASSTLISGDAAAAFQLPYAINNSITFHGVGGSRAARIAKVKTLTLGPTTVADASFFVLDDATDGKAPEVFGILGRDVLSAPEIELDFPHKTVRLLKAENCTDEDMPYWATKYSQADMRTPPEASATEVWVPAAFNDHPIIAEIDTGAQGSVVIPGVAQSAGGKLDQTAHASGGIGPAAIMERRVEFASFQIGEERISPAKLSVADLFAYNKELATNTLFRQTTVARPSMLLGADFLRSHRMMISYPKRRVYFSYEGGGAFSEH